jgi:hypothetical protein
MAKRARRATPVRLRIRHVAEAPCDKSQPERRSFGPCRTGSEGNCLRSKIPDKTSGLDHITDALGYMVMAAFPIITDSMSNTHPVLL